MTHFKTLIVSSVAVLALAAGPAFADNDPLQPEDEPNAEASQTTGDDETQPNSAAEPTVAEPLPPPQSDDDPLPPVAKPVVPPKGLVRQAGVGGQTAYGRAGVVELGGAAGFTSASDITQLSFAPSFGYFVADNLELTGILGASYISAGDDDATMFRALVEPSYHAPVNNRAFVFLGVGAGVAHVDGPGAGFALAPRLGTNILVGRSGILTPSISYQYTTHDSVDTDDGMELISVSSAISADIGYTIMW